MSSKDAAIKERLEQLRNKQNKETVSVDDAAVKQAMQDLKRQNEKFKNNKPPQDPSIKGAIVTIKVFGIGGGGNSVLKRIAESNFLSN